MLEVTAVQVTVSTHQLTFISAYIPYPSVANMTCFEEMLEDMPGHLVICADLNTHTLQWSNKVSAQGPRLARIFEAHALDTLNKPNEATYHSYSYAAAFSSPDVSVVSHFLKPQISDWGTSVTHNFSDHELIRFTLPYDASASKHCRNPSGHARWHQVVPDAWSAACDGVFAHWVREREAADDVIEQDVAAFTEKIVQLGIEVIGQKWCYAKSRPWFRLRPDIQALLEASHKAKRKFSRKKTPENRLACNRARKACSAAIQLAERQSWEKLCEKMSQTATPKVFWSLFKKATGSSPESVPTLQVGAEYALSAGDKAEALNDHFCNISRAKAVRPAHIRQYLSSHADDFREAAEVKGELNDDFSLGELQQAISRMSRQLHKAAGDDQISVPMLVYGGEAVQRALLFLFNKSWRCSHLPLSWKMAKVHPILKAGKDASLPESYRPISLLSVCVKLMERMLHTRLMRAATEHHWLSRFQSGFRPQHSTMDHLTRVCNAIWSAFERGEELSLVCLDIDKAYDRLYRDGLRVKLHQLGLRGRMLCWLDDFLSDRSQRVVINGMFSAVQGVDEGVPQGSVLSPLLFLFAMNDISSPESECEGGCFADDVCLWHTAPRAVDNEQPINQELKYIDAWAERWDVSFAVRKCSVTHFSRAVAPVVVPQIYLGLTPVPETEQVCYLGVILDKRLEWKPHLADVHRRAAKKLGMMKRLCQPYSGLTCPQAVMLYKQFVRPVMDYACPLWCSAHYLTLQPLLQVQRSALLWGSGAMRTTSLDALEVDCFVEPLPLRWDFLARCWWERILRLAEDHPLRQQCEQMRAFDAHSFLARMAPVHDLRSSSCVISSDATIAQAKKILRTSMLSRWQSIWSHQSHEHLFALVNSPRPSLHQWSRSRRLSSLRCQLRHGHCSLNLHLSRLGLSPDPGCIHCGETESVEHYLFECDYYAHARVALFSCVPNGRYSLEVLCATDSLLTLDQRRECVQALERFIVASARFD